MTQLISRVVKIQAIFRGKLVRKRLEEIRNAVQNGTEHGEFDDNCNENELFSNEKVKEVYDQLGKFTIPDMT